MFLNSAVLFCRNKILEVNKSIVAVKERCTNARLSLDLYYEKMKMELMKTIDDHYHKQSEMIEKAKKDDLGHLGNLDNQLQADMRKLEDFLGKGLHSICQILVTKIKDALFVICHYNSTFDF